jgi:hypothetical protein
MARIKVSTTVDGQLLSEARRLAPGDSDAALLDRALEALVVQLRGVDIDAAYAAYDRQPIENAEEWGDLASFRAAAAAT